MIIADEKKRKLHLELEVSEEALIEFRRLLFTNGLSVQECIAFFIISAQLKDQGVIQLIEMAKLQKIKNNENVTVTYKPSSSNALYNLLEQRSPLKQQR